MRALWAMVLAMTVASGLGPTKAAWAHEGHEDSTEVAAGPSADTLSRGAAGGPSPPPYKMPPLWKGLTDHPHNKIIHFPLVLTLVAAVMLIVARKKPELEPVAFWLVWAAALSVIPAYFSGQLQEERFEGKPKEWLVEIHEKVGITIAVMQALWVLSVLRANTRRFAWVIGLALAILMLVAGYLGGLVAHGH
jgi:uncharacterized membrane protein